ncbi:response regulator [Variovorax sp. J22R133]|uniref:response regulator n=1 Tax=Variovorax brevis TaxID=3053503 RepID=UPI00257887A1|nr:response regulator [Variovorax sp. J22R133]MDM0112504.1 response regulator [Variovorax sp. J22R133]
MQIARSNNNIPNDGGPIDSGEEEKANILIVDDLPEKLLVFQTVLEELGQNLVQVQSGAAALREILKHEFAVILLDVNMPDIDGFETAALIRKHRRSAHTPIIFITSYADEVQTAKGYSLGAVDYILSPVVPEILRSKVGVFVSLYRMTRQIRKQADGKAAVLAAEAARRIAEENDRYSAFLARASRVLSGSLQADVAMSQCAELLIPELAAFAVVQLTDPDFGQSDALLASTSDGHVHTSRRPDDQLDPVLRELLQDVVESRQRRVVHGVRMPWVRAPGDEAEPAWRPSTLNSFMAVPLLLGERVLGAILIATDGENPWKSHLTMLLEEIAARAAGAFENVRLYGVLQKEVRERMAAQEELQESNRRKDEFLAMMSHELRNPLAPIQMAVEVVRRTVTAQPKVTWALDIANRQLRQMTRLIEELLDVTRISQGKIVLKRERLDLNAVIAQGVETVHGLIESRRQKFLLELPPHPVWLDGDVARLTQVVANLLHNASKYSPEESSIALRSHVEGDSAVISVVDQGMGIDPELLPRIFDLFAQGKRGLDRSQGGLGVGLTLARRLAQLHGGDIEVHSAGHDKGSEFRVFLPGVKADPEAAIRGVVGVHADSRKAMQRVLVVDDNNDAAVAIAAVLELDGHEVRVARDGRQALADMVEFSPHVVVLDIGLPLLDGYEVARRIRKLPQGEGVLLIALTGYGQSSDRQAATDAGFDRHFVKPADAALLLACIDEWPAAVVSHK